MDAEISRTKFRCLLKKSEYPWGWHSHWWKLGSWRSFLRIPGLSGCGIPAVDSALDMCIVNKYLLSRISMDGERTDHQGWTLKAPSRPLCFHTDSDTHQLRDLGPESSCSSLGFLIGKMRVLNHMCSQIISRSPPYNWQTRLKDSSKSFSSFLSGLFVMLKIANILKNCPSAYSSHCPELCECLVSITLAPSLKASGPPHQAAAEGSRSNTSGGLQPRPTFVLMVVQYVDCSPGFWVQSLGGVDTWYSFSGSLFLHLKIKLIIMCILKLDYLGSSLGTDTY